MKKSLLSATMLAISSLLFAQLPKGKDGKDLYQKGECKTILPNVKYKCVFCEDEALTKNCKEYDCSLTECKESKNIKATDGKEISKPIDIQGKQVRMQQDSSKPSTSIDLTEFFNKKKAVNGTVVIYETESKYKIYATYSKGRLIEWYGMGEDGKKIKPSQLGVTPTTCEDCVVHPDGFMFCKKCTTTPGVILPAKRIN